MEIFILKSGSSCPPQTISNVWFRTYKAAENFIGKLNEGMPFGIEKWFVSCTSDAGGTPIQKYLLGLGLTEDAMERE